MFGFSYIMPLLVGLNELIKFSKSRQCFVCDFVVAMKLCHVDLYYWYTNPQNAYMGDVINGYRNLLNGTSDVVVHEWASDLNICLENLSF
jgi:hypothetical protein